MYHLPTWILQWCESHFLHPMSPGPQMRRSHQRPYSLRTRYRRRLSVFDFLLRLRRGVLQRRMGPIHLFAVSRRQFLL